MYCLIGWPVRVLEVWEVLQDKQRSLRFFVTVRCSLLALLLAWVMKLFSHLFPLLLQQLYFFIFSLVFQSSWILTRRLKSGVIGSKIWGPIFCDRDSVLCSDLILIWVCHTTNVSEINFGDLRGGDLGNPCPSHLLRMPGRIKFVFLLQSLQL